MNDNETQEEKAVRLLCEKGYTVATAESCTGGLLAGRIVNVPGASQVFHEGYITYSNEAKARLLGVSEETLMQYGAVSEETAAEMAVGAACKAGSNAALSTTGVAGPEGGTAEKPVGLVYIGCCVNGEVTVKEYRLTGNREENRQSAVVNALKLLCEQIRR